MKKSILRAIGHQIRRKFFYYTHREKVAEEIKKRQGTCRQCGMCCKPTLPCPFLGRSGETFICRIHEKKPLLCHLYPYNKSDLYPHLRDTCGYYFD